MAFKSNYSGTKPVQITPVFLKIAVLVVAISYIGGLWVNIQHALESMHETQELQPILHWLRDSSLAMVFIFFAVMMALSFSRWLTGRKNLQISQTATWLLTAGILGIFTGAAFALGIPVHGYLFGEHVEEGASLLMDMLRDGSQVALVNMGLSWIVIFIFGGLSDESRPSSFSKI
ncbi:MAG TPA: hypothetical protein PKL78_08950 [Anaerolineales bacterium]|nr:hypothetical protein [Anaerolineales bacterium]HNN13672.1 hypothetical protein [Anaerolineales bacterium]HNO30244.1 hypothetical protein [Anaerolineales bacterium]